MNEDLTNKFFKTGKDKKNNKQFYIKIKGKFINVSEEIYRIYYRTYDNYTYRIEKEVANSMIRYDDIDKATFFVAEKSEKQIIDQIFIKHLADIARYEISRLNEPDHTIAEKIFIEEYSIRETAMITGLSKSAVQRRKVKIQKLLQEKIKKAGHL